MTQGKKPYTTGEVAALSHVTINAVKKWIATGKLPAHKTPGGHYRIGREDFKRFVSEYGFKLKTRFIPEKVKVLITDDEPSVVNYLREALLQHGKGTCEVETAADGYEALIKVGSFEPDLLVLDIRMPRINGLEVCRRLRGDAKTSGIKILAVTAFGSTDEEKVLEAGADVCLHKPIPLDEFHAQVDELLRSRYQGLK